MQDSRFKRLISCFQDQDPQFLTQDQKSHLSKMIIRIIIMIRNISIMITDHQIHPNCNHDPGWAAPFEGHHAVHQAMDRGADDCWLQGARHHHRCHSYHSGVDIISFIRIYSIIITISCRRRNVKRRLQQRPLTLPCLDNFHPMMMMELMVMMMLLMLMMVDDGDDDDATWVNVRESPSYLASPYCQRQWCHLWSPGSDLQWATGYHHWPFLDSGVRTKLLSLKDDSEN